MIEDSILRAEDLRETRALDTLADSDVIIPGILDGMDGAVGGGGEVVGADLGAQTVGGLGESDPLVDRQFIAHPASCDWPPDEDDIPDGLLDCGVPALLCVGSIHQRPLTDDARGSRLLLGMGDAVDGGEARQCEDESEDGGEGARFHIVWRDGCGRRGFNTAAIMVPYLSGFYVGKSPNFCYAN